MNKYKRITKQDNEGNWYVEYENGDIVLAPSLASQDVFKYLAELENKIERCGKLGLIFLHINKKSNTKASSNK